ncbi:irc3 [Candida pseudojiufengensis]|uniref:irc3 n=1 Tax=Candida pseudojiufengensis TaxID=497109 RepID=UPI0022258E80|nr:irc3 [Candida pseudojiufengensis]KAI5960588.1 irc3 [Candida pseudojiufengensis]
MSLRVYKRTLLPKYDSLAFTSRFTRRIHSTFSIKQASVNSPKVTSTDQQDFRTNKLIPEFQTLFKNVNNNAFKLRDYQEEAVNAVLSSLDSGIKRPAVVIATGGGKTVIFSHLINHLKPLKKDRGNKVLVLAHTEELIDQAAKKIRLMNPHLKVDIEMRSLKAEPNCDVVVASVPSLKTRKRLERFNPKEFKSIIIDECHHAPALSYRKILNYFKALDENSDISVIGFTATFIRLDGQALGHIFQKIVFERSLTNMISSKELAEARVSEVEVDMNLDTVSRSKVDYDSTSLYNTMKEIDFNDKIILAYMRLKEDSNCQSTLIFCVSVDHCYDVCSLFQSHGINAQYVTGSTSKTERAAIIEDFKEGKIPVLCNVQVFTEGTDMPNIDSLILARPTLSKSLMVQMIGRGLRLHKDKTHCHIVDMVDITKQGIDVMPTLDGENLTKAKPVDIEEEVEEEDVEEEEVPETSTLSEEQRGKAIAKILDYHKKEVLTLKEQDRVFTPPAIWFQDTQLTNTVLLKGKYPWALITSNTKWGLQGRNNDFFILNKTIQNGKCLFEISHHNHSNRIKNPIFASENLLDIFKVLESKYEAHMTYAKKSNTFARKATRNQVAYLMKIIDRKIDSFMRRKKIDLPKSEFSQYVSNVLLNQRQAIIGKYIFALKYEGHTEYEEIKTAQVLNTAFKSI